MESLSNSDTRQFNLSSYISTYMPRFLSISIKGFSEIEHNIQAMATALDTFCNIFALTEPENKFIRSTNKFLIQLEAVTRRVTSVSTKRALIELDDSNDASYMDEVLSEAFLQLLVPRHERSSLVKKVMLKASEAAQKHSDEKRLLRIIVNIDMYVIDDHYEKLKRTIIQVPFTVCSVCMEEIRVGDDGAIKLPCAHLYLEGCIVEWLQHRGYCPLCKYSMIYT